MTARPETARPLVRVPIPPGAMGADRLLQVLPDALSGVGAAVAPVPVVGPTTSQEYVAAVLDAVRADDPRQPLEFDDIALVVPTSGSTGNPRGVLLTAANLAPGTQAANGPRPLDVQWICALPVTSIGGINVLVRSLATGRVPIVMDSIGGGAPFLASDFAAAVSKAQDAAEDIRVSLVPPQVSKLMATDEGVEALRQCTLVLVGGAPLRPSVIDTARELGIGITTSYGSTETAGGCVFDGIPIAGASIELRGERIVVNGDVVARGYRGDPQATDEAFDGRTFWTSDFGEFSDDGALHVRGRIDDIVIVKGVNVSPQAVEQIISDLPDIAAAAVIVTRDSAGEPQLVAFVQVRDNAPNITDAVAQGILERLGRPAVPKRTVVVDALPHLPHGKVDRRLLEDRAKADEN